MNVETDILKENEYTKLLSQYAGFELNEDQKGFVRAMADFLNDDSKRVFILQGCAGSGKTFLMQGVARYLFSKKKKVSLIAPTGKAAKVLTKKSGFIAYTIHAKIYNFHEVVEVENKERNVEDDFLKAQVVGESDWVLHFNLKFNVDDISTVYIVDESSLIGNREVDNETLKFGSGKLLHDLLTYINPNFKENARKVIFVGDMYQLPPVGMNHSPALTVEDIYKECPYLASLDAIQMYMLQAVVRQKEGSGVLKVATYIREKLKQQRFNEFLIEEHPHDVTKIAHAQFISTYMDAVKKKGLGQVIAIAYSNANVDIYNRLIREQLFPQHEEITEGDFLQIVMNTSIGEEYLLNGDFVRVAQVGTRIVRKVKMGEEEVELLFRDVVIEFEGCKHRGLLLETLLLSKERALTKIERKALYKDFMIRHSKEIAEAAKESKKKRHEKITELLLKDIYINALQVKYGYAITCHKSQGSEWDTVFLDCNLKRGFKNRETFQWFYTGVTRSSNQLYLVDMPRNLAMDGGIQAYAQSGRRAITSSDVDATMSASTMTARTTASNIGMPTVMSASTEMSQGLKSVGATQTTVLSEAELRKRVSCDWDSMSVAAQQIVLHMLRALSEIPCIVTDVVDHAYHVILTIQIDQQEGRVTVHYTGKDKISKFQKIVTSIPEKVFQQIITIAGKSTVPQVQTGVQNPFAADATMDESALNAVGPNAVMHSVVETFTYPPEYEYFLKEYMQRLQKKLEPAHIGITGIEDLQFNLRTTFTRGHQSAVIDIHYRAKGEFKKVGALDSRCSDEAFKDEVLSYILPKCP